MKSILVVLFALSTPAFAEDFTMTRGTDGHVFYCSDQGSGGGGGVSKAVICSCVDRIYDTDFGQVAGADAGTLATVCRQESKNGVLKNCAATGQPNGSSVICDCVDRIYGSNFGQVVDSNAANLRESCKVNSQNAILRNCKVQ